MLISKGSEDRSISISNENGDTIKYLSNMDADVNDLQFSCIKNDDNFSKEENTVGLHIFQHQNKPSNINFLIWTFQF